jgi:hypothetical protein
MSKAELCQFVAERPTYHLDPNRGCPDIEDFVTVEGTDSVSPVSSRVNVVFHDGVIHAMWTTFPATDFFKILHQLEISYRDPEQVVGMRRGGSRVTRGPYVNSKLARNAPELMAGFGRSDVEYPGAADAPFTNGYVYWRLKLAHIFLEEQNEAIDGVMMGWFAIIASDDTIRNSR